MAYWESLLNEEIYAFHYERSTPKNAATCLEDCSGSLISQIRRELNKFHVAEQKLSKALKEKICRKTLKNWLTGMATLSCEHEKVVVKWYNSTPPDVRREAVLSRETPPPIRTIIAIMVREDVPFDHMLEVYEDSMKTFGYTVEDQLDKKLDYLKGHIQCNQKKEPVPHALHPVLVQPVPVHFAPRQPNRHGLQTRLQANRQAALLPAPTSPAAETSTKTCSSSFDSSTTSFPTCMPAIPSTPDSPTSQLSPPPEPATPKALTSTPTASFSPSAASSGSQTRSTRHLSDSEEYDSRVVLQNEIWMMEKNLEELKEQSAHIRRVGKMGVDHAKNTDPEMVPLMEEDMKTKSAEVNSKIIALIDSLKVKKALLAVA